MAADRNGLGVLGIAFGGITAAVMLVAFMVVLGHVEGRFALEAAPSIVAALQ